MVHLSADKELNPMPSSCWEAVYSASLYFGCRHCYELSYRSRQEYDKRIANISLEQIEYINQQMDSIPTSQQVRWAMLYFKAAEYNWRWLDRIGKRLSEPDETKIYETMK